MARKPKGDGGKGTGNKKCHDNLRQNVTTIYDETSRQFATFYDNFRLFVPLT